MEPTVEPELLTVTQSKSVLLPARTEFLHQHSSSAGASQSQHLKVCILQENAVRHLVVVQVQIDYLQIWIPPDKSFELLLSHGIPDPFKLELPQPGETIEAQNAVVSVV